MRKRKQRLPEFLNKSKKKQSDKKKRRNNYYQNQKNNWLNRYKVIMKRWSSLKSKATHKLSSLKMS